MKWKMDLYPKYKGVSCNSVRKTKQPYSLLAKRNHFLKDGSWIMNEHIQDEQNIRQWGSEDEDHHEVPLSVCLFLGCKKKAETLQHRSLRHWW
jgi:hypothetical protein